MLRLENIVTLLSGSVIEPFSTHTAIVPEVVTFEDGTSITLENDKHEFIGTAEVTDVKIETFALLQNSDLANTCHPNTTTWTNALHELASQVEGFSQLDKVSIVRFFVDVVSAPGLTVNSAPPQTEHTSEAEPSLLEQFAALGTVGDLAHA